MPIGEEDEADLYLGEAGYVQDYVEDVEGCPGGEEDEADQHQHEVCAPAPNQLPSTPGFQRSGLEPNYTMAFWILINHNFKTAVCNKVKCSKVGFTFQLQKI